MINGTFKIKFTQVAPILIAVVVSSGGSILNGMVY